MLGGTFLRLIQLIFLSSVCYFKKLQRYATFAKFQTSAIVWTHHDCSKSGLTGAHTPTSTPYARTRAHRHARTMIHMETGQTQKYYIDKYRHNSFSPRANTFQQCTHTLHFLRNHPRQLVPEEEKNAPPLELTAPWTPLRAIFIPPSPDDQSVKAAG